MVMVFKILVAIADGREGPAGGGGQILYRMSDNTDTSTRRQSRQTSQPYGRTGHAYTVLSNDIYFTSDRLSIVTTIWSLSSVG